jgi:hypothetical protein
MSRGPAAPEAAAQATPARRPARTSPAPGHTAVASALGRLPVQRALKVGHVDDAYEREAAQVAERVGSGGGEPAAAEPGGLISRLVQRQAAPPPEEGPEPTPPATEPEPWPEPDEEELAALAEVQALPLRRGETAIDDPGLVSRLRAPGPGRPAPGTVLRSVAGALPYDFSGVRVHDGPAARRDASALSARAFTLGRDVWLGPGERADDVRLMAHELTHVVQQGAAGPLAPGAISARGPPDPVVQRQEGETAGASGDWLATLLGPLAERAQRLPGFRLLTFILERNPITQEPVVRTAAGFVQAVLELVPRGNEIWSDLQQSGALQRAVVHVQQQVALLGFTWKYVRGFIDRALARISGWDVIEPTAAIERVLEVFAEPLGRLRTFARNVSAMILELIVEGVLTLAGPLATRIMGVIRRASDTFALIVADPVKFLRHLGDAVGQGFRQFAGNIGDHLKRGLTTWLLGTLKGAGLQIPERLDLRGIVSVALQVLDLTWASLRARLAKVLGDRRLRILEKVLPFLATIATQGLAAAWQQLVQWIGQLRETVMDGIETFIRDTIVVKGIEWVLGLLTPIGAVIKAIQAIYNIIRFVMEQAERLAALADSVLDSITSIAQGRTADAANLVEQTLGRFVPVVIGLLARLAGLGNIGEKIREIIGKLRAKVQQAITRLLNWVVAKVKKLLGGAKAGLPPQQRLDEALDAGVKAVSRFRGTIVGAAILRPLLAAIRIRYSLRSLEPVEEGDEWWLEGRLNPDGKKPTGIKREPYPEDPANTPRPQLLPGTMVTLELPLSGAPKRGTVKDVEQIGGFWRIVFWPRGTKQVGPGTTGGTMTARAYHHPTRKPAWTTGAAKFATLQRVSPGKTTWIEAYPLQLRPSSSAQGDPPGWSRLRPALRSARLWIRAHLINGRCGGSDTAANLVPAPQTPVPTNERMYNGHEKLLQEMVPALQLKEQYLWARADVVYHDDGDTTEFSRASDFAKTIVVTWGPVAQDADDKWVLDPTLLGTSPTYQLRLPLRDELTSAGVNG